MANTLDLQEQEQLDELKAFWKQWGNAITWGLTLVLVLFAGWNSWQWYQRDQATKAAAVYDELDKAAAAGDAERAGRIFGDLKERYPRTAYAEQGALLAARVQFDKGQTDAATAALTWAADNASEDEYRTIARLRLAGVLLEAKAYDEALKSLEAATAPAFVALVADRRGDVLMAQGKKDDARKAYQMAWAGMDEKVDYRRLIEAKLTALGASPDKTVTVDTGAPAAAGSATPGAEVKAPGAAASGAAR